MVKREVDLLVENAGELITLRGGSKRPLLFQQMRNLGIIRDGSIAIDQGRVAAIGKADDLRKRIESTETLDAGGKVVMPGFVDPHTHLVFAGSREDEFEKKIEGASYLDILDGGGGILKTVRETRKASKQRLVEDCEKTLNIMLEHGTTTVEAKSGYGLTTEDELKCLEVIRILNEKHPIDIVPTFLGAHAIPAEHSDDADEYVNLILKEMIPAVAARQLAEFCDVFCEKGVFNVEQSKRILLEGKRYGLIPKIHADEMTELGGAELAAEVHAVSASHLLFTSDEGIKALARWGIVAVLLPSASFSLLTGRYADARRMIKERVAIALGTDYNPSCWLENQQITIALACHQMRMIPAEAIAAATINAAHTLNRERDVGSLEPQKWADLAILNIPNHRFLGYRFGTNLVDKVIKRGKLVVDEGRMIC